MNDSNSTNPQTSPQSEAPQSTATWLREKLKNKKVAPLTVPLLVAATLSEFAILFYGWRYQQAVCLPQGMGITFFGIGPIGATILMVELLKLPLAIWTASRTGWVKGFMLFCGLPLICLLTFQLVKDMAVYEMGVAMTPAAQYLEKASAEEIKIAHLNGDLAAIEQKRVDREKKLAELATKQSKTKAELEDSLKRNDATRQDAIALTDYQKKELSEVEMRQSGIIAQFNNDTMGINNQLATLRGQRETEVARNAKWNAEEARIDNTYKTKKADWDNKKAAYDKAKAEYDNANFVKRQLMKEPVSPGVPPERESNTVLKPSAVADIDAQIKAKEAELLAVNNKRRERVAQVDADARRIREEYDSRSVSKREQSDKKREELTSALTALATEEKSTREQIDKQFEGVAEKVDGIRGEIDSCRKTADGFYEARETAIRKTQVHRIGTTVEILRGLIKGERPQSIKATAKERGDVLTDQISMVRIWVYPVLAFIVAFLPTLMVEIGFTTIFEPEPVRPARPAHRIGFLGRRLHWLYIRAGRIKMASYERVAKEASSQIAARDKALAAAKATADRTLAETKAAAEGALSERDAEVQAAREAASAAEANYAEEAKKKEGAWTAKLASMAESLNRAVVEKDSLRDLQKSEVDRQVQMRQNAWSDHVAQMRKELDDQRIAAEAERAAMHQAQHKRLMEVTEECKTQVVQSRRQMADAELAAMEKLSRMERDLKDAMRARDEAETQLKIQADTLSLKLTQAQEDGTRLFEKASRQEKHRFERQQQESEKALRQKEEDFEHRLNQREQELTLAFEARLGEEKTKVEQSGRLREAELQRQLDDRAREVDARWKEDVQKREEAAQIRLKQREQQLEAHAEARIREAQSQAEEQLRRRVSDLERQLDVQARESDSRLKQDLQDKELAFQAKLKQREQELAIKADARETELRKQLASDLRAREEDWERQTQSRIRATESRLAREAQEREELSLAKSRQREEQWQVKLDGVLAELQAQTASIEPFKEQLARAEKERDEARHIATESTRHVETMEKKLNEASSFLTGWKNGKRPVGT
jgi:hypothetical protein